MFNTRPDIEKGGKEFIPSRELLSKPVKKVAILK